MLARSAVLMAALSAAGVMVKAASGQEHVHPGSGRMAHAPGHVRLERITLESGHALEIGFRR
jgi:hypothetical protein